VVTDLVGAPDNVLFWSNSQQDLLASQDRRNVIFLSGPGTGKTILSLEKAKRLLLRGEKVAFLLLKPEFVPEDTPTFLQLHLEDFFRECDCHFKAIKMPWEAISAYFECGPGK
jgi:hypothetical protein